MKKVISCIALTSIILLTSFQNIFAQELKELNNSTKVETSLNNQKIQGENMGFFAGENIEGYNFIEVSEPVDKNYDGNTNVLLGYYEPVVNPNGIQPLDNYREYDRWYVYDQGITKSWSYLSNPYFIISIARGMTYEKTKSVSATITGTFSKELPDSSLPSVKKSFGLNSSGSKKVTEKITFTGPSSGFSSRDFYYQKGRHTHKVKLVQEHRSNWDGVLWKKTYYGSVGKPAIKHYSLNRK